MPKLYMNVTPSEYTEIVARAHKGQSGEEILLGMNMATKEEIAGKFFGKTFEIVVRYDVPSVPFPGKTERFEER